MRIAFGYQNAGRLHVSYATILHGLIVVLQVSPKLFQRGADAEPSGLHGLGVDASASKLLGASLRLHVKVAAARLAPYSLHRIQLQSPGLVLAGDC